MPVDHVAAALVWLSQSQDPGTHHLANPQLTSFGAIVERVRAAGWSLPDVDRDKRCDLVRSDPANAAHPLLDAFVASWGVTGGGIRDGV